jgi:hypothetical protein
LGGASQAGGSRASGGALPLGGTEQGGKRVTGGATSSTGTSVSGGSSVDAGEASDAGGNPDGSNGLVPLADADFAAFTQAECCAWFSIMNMPIVHLELAVDVSASMGERLQSTNGGQSKWEATRRVLGAMLRRLPRSTRAGLLLWPNKATIPNEYTQQYQETGGVDACLDTAQSVRPSLLASPNRDQVEAMTKALNAAAPIGGTATADAYAFAVEELTNTTLMGEKFVVMLTDGQPSIQFGCIGQGAEDAAVDYQPVLDLVERAWEEQSVKTYVIGLPGSERTSFTHEDGRIWLSHAAELGMTGRGAGCRSAGPDYCHFDLSQSQDIEQALTGALDEIVEQVFSCRYPFPDGVPQPLDMSWLNTVYVPQTGDDALRFVTPAQPDCESGNGWYLERDGSDYLALCPNTCRAFRESGATLQTFGNCPALGAP